MVFTISSRIVDCVFDAIYEKIVSTQKAWFNVCETYMLSFIVFHRYNKSTAL